MPKIAFSGEPEIEIRKTVSITVTHNCNLRCRYCYEPNINRNKDIIELDMAKKIILKHMEANDGFQKVCFDFFGGEPLLGFNRIREIVEWFHSREWRKNHLFFIATNGTLLTDEMKSWLCDHKKCVAVGYSLDGTKVAHNLCRDNSYDLVRRNIPFFKENWPNQPAKMTICAETIPYVADSIIELENMGMHFTANVVFEDIWGDQNQKNKLLDIYADELSRLVDYYTESPELFPVSPILTRSSESIYATRSAEIDCFRFCGAGHEMIMYDVDGRSYPCHRFAPWVTKRQAPIRLVNRQKVWKPKECEICKLINLCPTCVGYNWEVNGDPSMRTTFHCDALKLEVLASAKLEALRLGKMDDDDYFKYYNKNPYRVMKRIEAILELLN
jgi:uncharacterized protein